MIKAVIFDLDGVLLSTDEFHYQAWLALADRERIYFDRKINERLRGVSREESLKIIIEKASCSYSQIEKQEMATYKNEKYKKLLVQISSHDLYPGVIELLDYLKEQNIKIAIGSSSKNAKYILKQTKLSSYFIDAVSDGTNISKSKPAPEVFLKAADFVNIHPVECMVIEDASAGIVAAKAAGMLACGFGAAKDAPDADCSASKLLEIKMIISALSGF